jgi:hypothetical protein
MRLHRQSCTLCGASQAAETSDAAWNPYLPSEILYVCTNSALHSFRLQDIQETQGPDAASAAAINGSLAAEVVAPAAWHNAQNGRQQMSIAVAGNARRVALAWGQDLLVTQVSNSFLPLQPHIANDMRST